MATKPMNTEDHEMIHAQLTKLVAETGKIHAETMKINSEARWYPFVATAGLFAAAYGMMKLLGN
ncbi:hypothetical protein EC912_103329 [Luteibacter rhizovicinus]|uniref:Uncharacterized protein n=1 Tax=Luteibacter rhizovicinus TaxID=242606 RepID=A0A4R3YQY4_9GAMM|nr:hypothetical protein [Luteibacter rhizovicinus]TCV94840.1 hypothetical protein EC912_103329 [Luteibacter rhizovicinus]